MAKIDVYPSNCVENDFQFNYRVLTCCCILKPDEFILTSLEIEEEALACGVEIEEEALACGDGLEVHIYNDGDTILLDLFYVSDDNTTFIQSKKAFMKELRGFGRLWNMRFDFNYF